MQLQLGKDNFHTLLSHLPTANLKILLGSFFSCSFSISIAMNVFHFCRKDAFSVHLTFHVCFIDCVLLLFCQAYIFVEPVTC